MSNQLMEKLSEELSNMSVIDMATFVKKLEDKWGVSAAAPVAAAAPAAAAEAVEEKTEFDVLFTGLKEGASSLNVIKEVRALTGLGLKEAKDLVDSGNSKVKEGISKAEAEKVKTQLDAAGAKVEIK